jgi:translocation and assembly module TamB
MHIGHLVFRTETSRMTADDIDIDWKPWQYLSRGVEIEKLYVKSLRMETLKEDKTPSTMPNRLAPPFKIAVDDARLAKAVFINKGAETAIDDIRVGLHGDRQQWKLDYARASTPWGQAAASGTIANTLPYKLDADASLSQIPGQARPTSSPPSSSCMPAAICRRPWSMPAARRRAPRARPGSCCRRLPRSRCRPSTWTRRISIRASSTLHCRRRT